MYDKKVRAANHIFSKKEEKVYDIYKIIMQRLKSSYEEKAIMIKYLDYQVSSFLNPSTQIFVISGDGKVMISYLDRTFFDEDKAYDFLTELLESQTE